NVRPRNRLVVLASIVCRLSSERHVDRLADTQSLRLVRQRFDQEDQFRTLFPAVDDRWREFRGTRDEADARREVTRTTIATDFHHIAISKLRQYGFWNKEADLEIARRQQRHNGAAGRHHLTGA